MDTYERAALKSGGPAYAFPSSSVPHTVVVTRRVVVENRLVEQLCGVCRGDSLSLYYKCDLCADQLAGNTYAKRMRLFAESAEAFSSKYLGRPYVEFKGGAA
jgi:hypothetical protein